MTNLANFEGFFKTFCRKRDFFFFKSIKRANDVIKEEEKLKNHQVNEEIFMPFFFL